jgi:hypothetical protein
MRFWFWPAISTPPKRARSSNAISEIFRAGRSNTPATAEATTLAARVDATLRDRVATTRLYRNWVVPGLTHEDVTPLSVGSVVLGGLASSGSTTHWCATNKVPCACWRGYSGSTA